MWAFKIFIVEFLLTIVLSGIIYGIWRMANPGKTW